MPNFPRAGGTSCWGEAESAHENVRHGRDVPGIGGTVHHLGVRPVQQERTLAYASLSGVARRGGSLPALTRFSG